MKKITLIIVTLFSILYSQNTYTYMMEQGKIDSITQKAVLDTIVNFESPILTDMNVDGLIIYTDITKYYKFFDTKDLYISDNIFKCTSIVKDIDNYTAIMEYYHNKASQTKYVLIRYYNSYFKYWLTT